MGAYFIVTAMALVMLVIRASIKLGEYEYLETLMMYGFLAQLLIDFIVNIDCDNVDVSSYSTLDTFILLMSQPLGILAFAFAFKSPPGSIIRYLLPLTIYALTWLYKALIIFAPSIRMSAVQK